MRCDAKLFICAQLRMCAEDGESQTLLIIRALIRMSALKNILEGLQLAHRGRLAFPLTFVQITQKVINTLNTKSNSKSPRY
jgi:hypothetical protein